MNITEKISFNLITKFRSNDFRSINFGLLIGFQYAGMSKIGHSGFSCEKINPVPEAFRTGFRGNGH